MIKIKICGITCRRNLKTFLHMPFNFIGLNFVPRSKRKIKKEKAKKIIQTLPKHIIPVLILENEDLENIFKLIKDLKTSYVQLHGNEDIDYCKNLKGKKVKIIKALKCEKATLKKLKSYEKVCDYILLDSSNIKGEMGGTGKTANWTIAKDIVKKSKLPVFLAGGLNPSNIHKAIKTVKPYAIDINSGIESTIGKKDKVLLEKLINNLI